MSRPFTATTVVIAVVWIHGFAQPASAAPTLSGQVSECLRARIEAAKVSQVISAREELIFAWGMLPRFYAQRASQPAWSNDDGPLPHVHTLVQTIQEADREGLEPGDYHLASAEAMLGELPSLPDARNLLDADRLADLDLLLTDAFLLYGSHVLAGRIVPTRIDRQWVATPREVDLIGLLQAALDTNQVEEALRSLLPLQPGYARLRQALVRYRDLAARGGWPRVPDGAKMQKGDRGARVVALRARLLATGELGLGSQPKRDRFDDAVERAVRRFQRRHGLSADGTVGPATLAALNVTAEERVRQIQLNLERWRWLPQDLGRRYVLINIPDFALDVVADGQSVLTMRAVVGEQYWRTPVFSATMTYVVLNPYWRIPRSIATKEMLPLIRKDPGYLARRNIKVFQRRGDGLEEVNPRTVAWARVSARDFPYRLRQAPGSTNALARMKFMFPNRFNVYLHDTPSPELFTKTARAFSHGCIRIEKPIELAEYVLQGDLRWTRDLLLATIGQQVTQVVWLPEPLPVHLLYWTAWVNEDQTVQFRHDLYGRDTLLDTALRKRLLTS